MSEEVDKVLKDFNVITTNGIPKSDNSSLDFSNDLSLGILLKPSDPDFPFDVSLLHIVLLISKDYPRAKPQIMVLNDDIPRGYSYNIEQGFKDLTGETVNETGLNVVVDDKSLCGYLRALDKHLEAFLSLEKKEARVKIVKQQQKGQKNQKTQKNQKSGNTDSNSNGCTNNMDGKTKPAKSKLKRNNNSIKEINFFKEEQIKILKCRLPVKVVKEGSLYKLNIKLYEPFQFQFDSVKDSITISILNIKLVIPQDYGQVKGRNRIKIEIDFSHPDMLKLINGISNPDIKLVLKKLLLNISVNFDLLVSKYRNWKLLEYLNFMVANLSKLMGDKVDFQRFIELLDC